MRPKTGRSPANAGDLATLRMFVYTARNFFSYIKFNYKKVPEQERNTFLK